MYDKCQYVVSVTTASDSWVQNALLAGMLAMVIIVVLKYVKLEKRISRIEDSQSRKGDGPSAAGPSREGEE